MRKISITVTNDQQYHMKFSPHLKDHLYDGISIDFFFEINVHDSEMKYIINNFAKSTSWLLQENKDYFVDLDALTQSYPSLFLDSPDWLKGKIEVKLEHDSALQSEMSIINFSVTYEEIINLYPQKIFLSHKGANKDLVRKFYKLLKEMGFDPWIDEEDMEAGVKLYRSILKGFKDSCAVIFFITPEFKDEDYLETEVDYAIKQKHVKKQNFSIITLQFKDQNGNKGNVPELLQDFVWKSPDSELEAFQEIIKSLPIKVGTPIWRKI
ncbi:toll/interleukin-1 receptor domain-containing protein [Paenibacillus kandeliae]|uniref:toll/interleukin-1 receptor domain-containing protein n=1 Tax=Paenibacillus kandeliae TaxID=3231269 RepID=UPI003458DC5C